MEAFNTFILIFIKKATSQNQHAVLLTISYLEKKIKKSESMRLKKIKIIYQYLGKTEIRKL